MFSVQNGLILAVVSREEVQRVMHSYSSVLSKLSLISITDPDRPNLDVDKTLFKNVIESKFWDLEEDFAEYKIITTEQGTTIRNFINENELFLVHCEAGISRSAGVAKAIECIKWFNSDVYLYETSAFEDSIRNHQRYFPNHKVFRTVMNGNGRIECFTE